MAWTADTIWCDPKFADLSSDAFKAYIFANSYSSGFLLRGHLTAGQLKKIGASPRVRRELIAGLLWHDDGEGGIHVNDWDEHNGKRDDRRERDRERKRAARLSASASAGQSAGRSRGASGGASPGTARVEGSEGSEGSTRSKPSTPASPKPADPIWDFVAEIEGEPLPRYKAARGRIVADLRELVRYLPSDRQVPELRLRHEALCREWGDAKATSRALVQHFVRAGRMANGESRPPQPKDERFFNADELYKRAQASQLAQKGAPELESG